VTFEKKHKKRGYLAKKKNVVCIIWFH